MKCPSFTDSVVKEGHFKILTFVIGFYVNESFGKHLENVLKTLKIRFSLNFYSNKESNFS